MTVKDGFKLGVGFILAQVVVNLAFQALNLVWLWVMVH